MYSDSLIGTTIGDPSGKLNTVDGSRNLETQFNNMMETCVYQENLFTVIKKD